ncbi:hypothetical protein NPIL_209671 [Nephila pilipes]|uniref:Uncharacterized protein n=1 Tax=Nephila pilipes TaxID=299642 RepID=A0A8X6IPJ5_NEPPI|nr:hypothetical protein NPIL_209671 [Nephila pilipes]
MSTTKCGVAFCPYHELSSELIESLGREGEMTGMERGLLQMRAEALRASPFQKRFSFYCNVNQFTTLWATFNKDVLNFGNETRTEVKRLLPFSLFRETRECSEKKFTFPKRNGWKECDRICISESWKNVTPDGEVGSGFGRFIFARDGDLLEDFNTSVSFSSIFFVEVEKKCRIRSSEQ